MPAINRDDGIRPRNDWRVVNAIPYECHPFAPVGYGNLQFLHLSPHVLRGEVGEVTVQAQLSAPHRAGFCSSPVSTTISFTPSHPFR
jgi:hypothetical protein